MELTEEQIKQLNLDSNQDRTSLSLPVWERFQEGGRTKPINQDILFKNFCEVTSILTKHQVKYAVSHGTLLGIHRINSLIPWDDDIDITLFVEDMPKISKVEDELRTLGYWVPERTANPNDKVIATEKGYWYDFNAIRNGEKIEGCFTEKIENKYVYDKYRERLEWSEKHFDALSTIKWRDTEFSAPTDIEGYLNRMYPGNKPILFETRKIKYTK